MLASFPLVPIDDAETLKALRIFHRHGVHRGHRNLQRQARMLASFPVTIPVEDRHCKAIAMPPQRPDRYRPIGIGELELDRWHRGRVLRGWLRARPCRILGAWASVVEDGSGRAVRILVSSVVFPDFFTGEVETMLPDNGEVVVYEPLVVESGILCRGTCLWVSNPAAFEVSRALSKPWDDPKAVRGSEPDVSRDARDRLLCRAETWLKMGWARKALDDAASVLDHCPGDERALQVKVQALWKLQQYRVAEACLEESLRARPPSLPLQRLYEEARVFKVQSETGSHDLSNFFKGGCKQEQLPNVADFVGPIRIEVTKDGRGRGLFTTRDVRRGDLLLVSNAAVRVSLRQDMLDKMDQGDNTELLASLLQVCLTSSRTLEQVYSMAEAAIDPETLRPSPSAVVEKPAPCMELFQPNWDMSKPGEAEDLEFDVVRLRNILGCSTEFVLSENYSDEFVGFWTLPAFINHSCLPNVSIRKFGRSMFVFAARDLTSGSELLRSYGYALRPQAMRSKSGFDCQCQRCLVEKKVEQPLRSITKKFMELLADKRPTIEQCGEYIQMAVDLEQALSSVEGLSQVEKRWIRASYPAAYMAYFGIGDTAASYGAIPMPDADEMLRGLQETAPGDIMTLSMMFRYKKLATSSQGEEILKSEVCAAFGHLKPDVMEAIMEHLESGVINATV